MIDNQDGTVTYSEKEIADINTFLNKVYNAITDYRDNKEMIQ